MKRVFGIDKMRRGEYPRVQLRNFIDRYVGKNDIMLSYLRNTVIRLQIDVHNGERWVFNV